MKHCSINFFIFILLLLNFQLNFSVNDAHFDSFQRDSEAFVIGRLIKTKKDGILSHGGFHGRVLTDDSKLQEYNKYYDESKSIASENFEPYYSQIGFQTMIYGAIVKWFDLDISEAIILFRWLNSAMLAALFVLFCHWVREKWGTTTQILVVISIFMSCWITLFASNPYWVTWVLFLPFVLKLIILEYFINGNTCKYTTIFWISFLLLLFKCLMNGYEYITVVLLACLSPYVFYSIYQGWSFVRTVNCIGAAILGMSVGVILTILILCFQLSTVMGSLSQGFEYVVNSLAKRTHGDYRNHADIFADSLKSSWNYVIAIYLKGPVIDLSNFNIPIVFKKIHVTFSLCIFIFTLATGLLVFSNLSLKNSEYFKKQIALAAMTWFSLLAPLSWFLIFKGHSFIHTHMNYIVWYIPFILIGSVLSFSTILFFLRKLLWNKN